MGHEVWEIGDAYEAYVGRWSRPVAREFVALLAVPAGRSWLDVGCGPGALATAALISAGPLAPTGVAHAQLLAPGTAVVPGPKPTSPLVGTTIFANTGLQNFDSGVQPGGAQLWFLLFHT